MNTFQKLIITAIALLSAFPAVSQNISAKEGFTIESTENKINMARASTYELELEIARSRKYRNRPIELNIAQIPPGVQATLNESITQSNRVKITIETSRDVPLGKHFIVVYARDKFKRKATMLTLTIMPGKQSILSTPGQTH